MAIPLRVLIVEDSESDADLILLNLESAGFSVTAERVQTAESMKEALGRNDWDVVISDCSLPSFSAHGALAVKKATGLDIPFIVVSGTVGEETAVELMKLGAQDYLMKERLTRLAPVVKRELYEAQMRREHRRAENSLREREAQYRNLIDNIPHIIYTFSLYRSGLFYSPQVEPILGYTGEALIADPGIWRSSIHADDRLRFDAAIAECSRGNSYDLEYRIHDKSGTEHWFRDHSIKISVMGDDTVVDGIASDITERKRMETEVQISNFELAKLYELSRALAEAENLNQIFAIVTRCSVEDVHTTFSRIAYLDGNELVIKSAYPVRALDHELFVGFRYSVTRLPVCLDILKQDEPVVLDADDPSIGPFERSVLLLDHVKSICLVPLRGVDGGQHLKNSPGILMLGEARNKERESFTTQKIRMARSIAEQASSSIHRMGLREENIRRLKKLSALSEIDSAISTSLDLPFILATILAHIVRQLSVDAADVLLFDPSSRSLRHASGLGFRGVAAKGLQFRLGEGHAGIAAAERCLVHVDKLEEPSDQLLTHLLAGEDFVTYYGIPLVAKDQIQGVLEVFNRSPLVPDDEWLDFFRSLAKQAAIAIDNSTLFDSLQRSNSELTAAYDATIQGWSRALDLRDKETEGHTIRVTEMTVRLARAMGFGDEETVQIQRGALLHDIGKMGVPDAILLKPGPLTEEEWVMMKKHPVYAYELLSPIQYLSHALDIPYCHHEKWDGTGYPRGLKGEEIPLAARIFAVVDVWDALRSDRPYRAAWPEKKVMTHIESLSGSHFDPRVVELFLKNL